MKRKGYILLELLLALFLLSALAAAVFPLLGQAVRAVAFAGRRGRMVNESVFAADFMVEKIRNDLSKEVYTTGSGRVYPYQAYIWKKGVMEKVPADYRLFVDAEKLKVRLYNGVSQPVTGTTAKDKEEISFLYPEEGDLFHVEPQGLVMISFRMESRKTKDGYAVKTAVLPYRRFYGGS